MTKHGKLLAAAAIGAALGALGMNAYGRSGSDLWN